MPLFERARIEVYVPDASSGAYPAFLEPLEAEFTYTFGGCTIFSGITGNYLQDGPPVTDRLSIVYTDIPARFEANLDALELYADSLRRRIYDALDEEAVLIVIHRIYHSIDQ